MSNPVRSDEARVFEASFRRGACHAAHWINTCAAKLAKKGNQAKAIASYLSDLEQVLMDWRNGQIKEPKGNPWEWATEELVRYIREHRHEW